MQYPPSVAHKDSQRKRGSRPRRWAWGRSGGGGGSVVMGALILAGSTGFRRRRRLRRGRRGNKRRPLARARQPALGIERLLPVAQLEVKIRALERAGVADRAHLGPLLELVADR